jgi:hypothetical protein
MSSAIPIRNRMTVTIRAAPEPADESSLKRLREPWYTRLPQEWRAL